MARSRQTIETSAAWIIAGVFVYASVVKIWSPDVFLQDILSYQLVDYRLAFFVALALPPVELIAGLLLLRKPSRAPAASAIALMMLVFTLALITAWARGLDISCGCFGKSEASADYPMLLIRDLALLGVSVFLMLSRREARASS
ncbi:MAG: MauE/DoxX family redox-associated membrane protein [Opitutales bacterium]